MADDAHSSTRSVPARRGPPARPPRDGDKVQARQRVNVLVRTKRLPHPNTLPCKDCGHVWTEGERRHEYDHHLGYGAANHYDVEPVCTLCHARRDNAKATKTHCIRGHEFNAGNTYVARNGTRHCRECLKAHEKSRGPRGSEYWREVNRKRGKVRG